MKHGFIGYDHKTGICCDISWDVFAMYVPMDAAEHLSRNTDQCAF